MATSLNTGVPWVMCQQKDAPNPIVSSGFHTSMAISADDESKLINYIPSWIIQIDTCNGFYCDQYTPNSNNKPKMWTENWSGWYNFRNAWSLLNCIVVLCLVSLGCLTFPACVVNKTPGSLHSVILCHIDLQKMLLLLLHAFTSSGEPSRTITWYNI